MKTLKTNKLTPHQANTISISKADTNLHKKNSSHLLTEQLFMDNNMMIKKLWDLRTLESYYR